jgi:hypothetical protein
MARLVIGIAFSCPVLLSGLLVGLSRAEFDSCELSAQAGWRSCRAAARSDNWLALGKCDNLPDAAGRAACSQQASADWKDVLQTCKDQNGLRQAACDRLGPAHYAPVIAPANFVATVDNPYFPLTPGTTFISEGQTADGFEHVEFAVTHRTRVILGVTCVEVHDTRKVNGKVVEDTRDWFAQDGAGNVWYFGENTAIVEGGTALVDGGLPTDLSGTWTAGVDGAQPGIIMRAQPAVGDFYRQEFLLDEAEDLAEVKSLTASVTVPYGSFDPCLKTEESSPLAPGDVESKFYAAGVGQLLTIEPTGERVELVQITTE